MNYADVFSRSDGVSEHMGTSQLQPRLRTGIKTD